MISITQSLTYSYLHVIIPSQVIVVVWDERTSNDIIPGGFMGTHDEETFAFFSETNVQCFKHPRHQVRPYDNQSVTVETLVVCCLEEDKDS